jgi:hypothetical protein
MQKKVPAIGAGTSVCYLVDISVDNTDTRPIGKIVVKIKPGIGVFGRH